MAITMLRAAAATAAVVLACAMIFPVAAEKLYTKTFRSIPFILGPGDVCDKYLPMEMPKGHITLRSFNGQVVDEDGVPVPLHETYLHHWAVHRYYTPTSTVGLREPIRASNWGVCDTGNLDQMYGLGSETRRTATDIPAPYGIEVGNPESVPEGHEEIWELNIHAIDTRGAVDKRGCTECVCELYNITVDPSGEHDHPIPEDYPGGLECCYDETHCVVHPDYEGPRRTLFMEYYVNWVEMSSDDVSVKVYIFDVTDERTTVSGADKCWVEYTVPKCTEGEASCIYNLESTNFLPKGGDVIYGVAHQHAGGIGSTLYNSDGSEICSSMPTYGNGSKAGNEAGYIVGMSTCYPTPGQVKVRGGEGLRLTSWYNNEDRHTGVMGLFYILVDESTGSLLPAAPQDSSGQKWILFAAALVYAVVLIAAIVAYHLKKKKSGPEDYERLRAGRSMIEHLLHGSLEYDCLH